MKNAAHYYANIDIFVLNYSFFFFLRLSHSFVLSLNIIEQKLDL